ncbi:hypothetical protein CSOJ01_05610 [Colletotrichum sojae]|uniref:Uncharacterized protein n=1 Tax=Colletotrichum sojae TaxID=2175907 RepID=A0A8H6JFG1_9PEZI|nr:hypothetical protein CSOJ01_05610 [Colletotrichum sojae]
MPSPATNVVLRKITIVFFPFAFTLLLIHGIITNCSFPALDILPLAGSALLSILILRRDLLAALGSPIQALSESNIFAADIVLLVFDFIFLIISWATIREPWDRGQIVLGTYGTVPLMVDFGIHAYLSVSQLGHMFVRRSCDCPHCRDGAKSHFSSRVSEYTPLSEAGTEPEVIERDLEEGVTRG